VKEISQFALPAHMTDTPVKESGPRNVIGKDDFMKLLMVQLQNQDPLKPMDHEQFSAQLAQFSSLEQLTNIGKGIDKLHGGMGEEQKLQALGMIGRKVTAQGNELTLVEGHSVTMNYSLPENVTPNRAFISDASGNIVRELPMDGKDTGSSLTWDGKSQEGVSLPSAKYTFRVAGVDQNGVPHEAGAELSGTVTGVELDGKAAILIVKNGSSQSRIEMSKIRQVALDANPGQQTASQGPTQNLMNHPKVESLLKAANASVAPVEGAGEEEAVAETSNESPEEADRFRPGDFMMGSNPRGAFIR